jgi:uncharacterized delta-60 repeat protein
MIGLPLKRSRLPHRFQRAILFAIIASMPLVAAGARPATAIQQRQPSDGPLDESFGFGGGFVTTSIGVGRDEARAVAVQPDGKIVVAGSASTAAGRDMALVRYNPNGTLDTSFGNGGRVVTPVGGYGEATALVLQPDGKIVTAGYAFTASGGVFVVARFAANGPLDPSFGAAGLAVTPIGTDAFASGVALQSGGRIVAIGSSLSSLATSPQDYDFTLVRYTANGLLDSSFGNGGIATARTGSGRHEAYAGAVLSDGRIVAAGYSSTLGDQKFQVTRYSVDGSLDTTFGTGGSVTTDIGTALATALSLAVQTDGKLIVGGAAGKTSAIVRYHADGSLDASFGVDGKVISPTSANVTSTQDVTLQPDGKIVAVGFATTGLTEALVVTRYLADGALDPTFGVDGKATPPIGDSGATAVAVQPDGKLVVAGITSSDHFVHSLLVVARFDVAYSGLVTGAPTRVLDTRPGPRPAAGSITRVTTGAPAGTSAVLVNLTVTGATEAGYLTANKCSKLLPGRQNNSNVNYQPGADVANSAVVNIDPDGSFCLYTDHAAHLIVDLQGRYAARGLGLVTAKPTRVLDTRTGARPAVGSITRVTTGAPAGTSAVLVNLTVTGATEAGYLTANKCSTLLPGLQNNSNVNYQAGSDVANSAVVNIDPDGSFCLYTDHAAHLIVDLQGTYQTPQGRDLTTSGPTRVLDTRSGPRAQAGSITRVTTGAAAGTSAVLVNLTVTGATEAGYLTANKCSTLLPGLQNNSNVNYQAGSDVANSAVVNIDPDGSFCLYTDHAAHLIVDLQGAYP